MPIQLDIPTIFFTSAIVGGMGLLLLLRASPGRRDSWFLFWVGFSALQPLASLMNGFRPVLPLAVAVVGANLLQLLAVALLWAGMRSLRGRPAPAWAIAAAPLAWGLACLIPDFVETPSARVGLLIPLIFALFVATAFEAWMIHREQGMRGTLDLAVLLGLVSVGAVLRILGIFDAPVPVGPGGALFLAILTCVVPFLALSVTNERRHLEDVARLRSIGRMSSLGEMAAGLAEELRTPLAITGLAVRNVADAVENGDQEARRFALDRVRQVEANIQRAGTIIDRIRGLERGAEECAQRVPVSLAQVVDGAASLTRGSLQPFGIALDIRIPPDLPPLLGQMVPLEQVFANLILNARDAICATGRRDGVIGIEARATAHRIEVHVEDNGGGIPETVLLRVFDPFFSTKPPGEGTGLGLSIVAATMRKCGGDVTVSNDGDGARFRLTFPRAPDR